MNTILICSFFAVLTSVLSYSLTRRQSQQRKRVVTYSCRFRERFPIDSGWKIVPEITCSKKAVLCRTALINPSGVVIASATSEEHRGIFNRTAVEKAENSAVERLMAFTGFGSGREKKQENEKTKKEEVLSITPSPQQQVLPIETAARKVKSIKS